jgi:hypothetical protein
MQQNNRTVLNPQPAFNGQHLHDTKVFEGETLQELIGRAEEARRICGIGPGEDLSQFTFERQAADGVLEVAGLTDVIQANAEYVVAPSNFIRARS